VCVVAAAATNSSSPYRVKNSLAPDARSDPVRLFSGEFFVFPRLRRSFVMAENYEKEIAQLEKDFRKKLPAKKTSDAKSSHSSSDDEDVDRVMAILTPEFGDDFLCTAGSNCHFDDPKSHPKGTAVSLVSQPASQAAGSRNGRQIEMALSDTLAFLFFFYRPDILSRV
jgi:hypothetical protein